LPVRAFALRLAVCEGGRPIGRRNESDVLAARRNRNWTADGAAAHDCRQPVRARLQTAIVGRRFLCNRYAFDI